MYFPDETKIIAISGHRPQRIDGTFDYTTPIWDEIYDWYAKLFERESPSLILTGMAIGVDTVAAVAALNTGHPVAACVPFEGQDRRWPSQSRKLYAKILEEAKYKVVVDQGHEWHINQKMQKRNEFMVDNSSLVAATWDGIKRGGTWNCIKYARSVDRPVLINNPMGVKNGTETLYKQDMA